MNKTLEEQNQELKERNALLENAFFELKKNLDQLSKLIGAKKIDNQKHFYTSVPEDEL